MALPCFETLGMPELTKKYEDLVAKGMPEFDAGIKVATDWHRKLHREMNNLKRDIGVKQDEYVPFDNSAKIKEINDRYEKTKLVDKPNKNKQALAAKKVYKDIGEIDPPSDARGLALEYLAGGGKINERSVNEIAGTVKRASLNIGAKEVKSSEVRGRDYITKDAPTITKVAHAIFDNLPEGLQSQISDRDVINELNDVVKNHNTRLSAAIEFRDRYIVKEVQSNLTDDEAKEMSAAMISGRIKIVEGLPENQQEDLIKLLGKYEDQYSNINWEKLEKDSEGFNPDILSLPEETRQALDAIIQKNISQTASESDNDVDKNGISGKEKEISQEEVEKDETQFNESAATYTFKEEGTQISIPYQSFTSTDYPTSTSEVQREEGEISERNVTTVRGIWSKVKELHFSGKARVKSHADVAHIMRLLENKSVEHGFAVHVNSKGKVFIQFLSIGGRTGTIVDPKDVLAGAIKHKAVKTYLVHNHPSGNLSPSDGDIQLTNQIREGFGGLGIKVQHVIMDTYKEQYTLLDEYNDVLQFTRDKEQGKEVKYTSEVFDGFEALAKPLGTIKSSKDVVTALQQFRFSALPKHGVLILNRMNVILANYVIKDNKEAAGLVASTPTATSVIFYGNTKYDEDEFKPVSDTLKNLSIKVVDYVTSNSSGADIIDFYISVGDEGMLSDIQAEYGTNSVSEPTPLERVKAAKNEYDKAVAELKKSEDKIAGKQATQTGMFGKPAQTEMFGVGIDEAKDILNPLRKNVKEKKAVLEKIQLEIASKGTGAPTLFSIRDEGDPQIEKTAAIVREYMDEGIKTDLASITESIVKLRGKDTPKLREQIKKAFDYYQSRYVPKEIHGAVVERIKKTFGKLLDAGVHVYKDAAELLKAAEQYGNVQFMGAGKEVVGFAAKGSIHLNGEKLNANSPIHESSHIYLKWAQQFRPQLYERGMLLIEKSKYLNDIKNNEDYKKLAGLKGKAREDYFKNEALATAIGDKGEQFISNARKANFREWLNNLWSDIKAHFGIRDLSLKQMADLTLDEFSTKVAADILSGQELPTGKPKFRYQDTGKKEPVSPQEETPPIGRRGERKFTLQELKHPLIAPEAKVEIQKNLEYVRQVNRLSLQEAQTILDTIGPEEAYDLVVNGDLQPAVRSVLGQLLILQFNKLAVDATDQDTKDYYHDKTIAIANFSAEKMGTMPGQMIQALSLFQRLSPEGQLRAANKEVKEHGKKKKAKRKKDTDKVSEKFKQANEEAAEEVIQAKPIKEKVQKAETATVRKAKDKIQQARTRRENLIKKHKRDKGKNLYSTVPGLSSEGIEFVGNLAKTYLDEGVAQLQIIVDNILTDLKDVAGKDPTQEVISGVNSIVAGKIYQLKNKQIAPALSNLEKEIGVIIKKHYTVTEEEYRTLTEKFMQDAGLDQQEAAELSAVIEKEFDAIATRKKNDILHNEKVRFDRIQKNLKGSKRIDKKTLQDEIIKFTNLGAFANDQLLDFIAKKMGSGSLSVDEAQAIIELANKIQAAPEGSPKNEATEDLLRYRAELKGVTFGEVGQAVWYANVLSGYITQIKNFVSTFSSGVFSTLAEAGRDPLSLPVLLTGGVRGIPRGLTEAGHTLSTGRSPIHISKIETPTTLERVKFWGGYFNPASYLKFVGRLMIASDVLQFQALKEMRATQSAYREARVAGHKNPFSKETWRIVNVKLFNTKERYDEAREQATDEGFTGIELKRRVYELMELSRPVQMTEDAYGFAAHGTFNHEPTGTLGALTNAVAKLLDVEIKGVKPARFFVPFTRILANVANNYLDYTVIGYVRAWRGVRGFEDFQKRSTTKNAYHQMDSDEKQRTIAKASLGIGITAALWLLTQIKGDDDEPIVEITGNGTGDFKKDAQLRQSGWQPYSIKIGDEYYSYALTPLMLNLAWIGNRHDRAKYDKDFAEETEMQRMIMSIFQSGQMVSDMTWIGSSADLLKAMASLNPKTMAKSVEASLKSMAKGFVIPNLYSQIAQKVEQINNLPQKQVNGLYEELIQDIPIARNSLNDKINALGDPMVRDRDILVSRETQDPIWKFLLDKKGWVAPINKNSFIIFDPNTGLERLGTGDEYYEFSKLRGAKIKEGIAALMENGAALTSEGKVTMDDDLATSDTKDAKDLSPSELQQLLKTISGQSTKAAKKELFADDVSPADE